jgi:protein arginine kinase activator
MLCQNCQQKIANVYFTKVVNNIKIELYLCENCAKKNGHYNIEVPLNINNFFNGLLGFAGTGQFINTLSNAQVLCEKCGMSYEEFQKVGKLGCDNCYEIYSDRLNPLIRRLHGNTKHTGKIPGKIAETMKVSKKIEDLKMQLNRAIQNEEYEKAAEIRDIIKMAEVNTCNETS